MRLALSRSCGWGLWRPTSVRWRWGWRGRGRIVRTSGRSQDNYLGPLVSLPLSLSPTREPSPSRDPANSLIGTRGMGLGPFCRRQKGPAGSPVGRTRERGGGQGECGTRGGVGRLVSSGRARRSVEQEGFERSLWPAGGGKCVPGGRGWGRGDKNGRGGGGRGPPPGVVMGGGVGRRRPARTLTRSTQRRVAEVAQWLMRSAVGKRGKRSRGCVCVCVCVCVWW
jgi:hypothetical protein